jgi:circadian clock protein KaiB
LTSVLTLKTAKPHRGPQTIEVVLSGGLTGKYHLRLYVAGATARSRLALRRIYQLCEREYKGNYELEVIDVYQQPEQARENQIVATPTLVKFLPLPMRRFIGNLSNLDGLSDNPDLVVATETEP